MGHLSVSQRSSDSRLGLHSRAFASIHGSNELLRLSSTALPSRESGTRVGRTVPLPDRQGLRLRKDAPRANDTEKNSDVAEALGYR